MSQVPEMSPSEFISRWPESERGRVVLLDVREPAELAIARVGDAIHIPMRDVPMRIGELDRCRPLVVMCHTGMRSGRVTEYLLGCGFDEVYNLAGGIDAWSREVDTAVPSY